ncbi:MAG: ABC transporter permease [Christensenellaceae bacterium]|nr:ABC transporter permease [Christensenellaceae bacterium]
MIREISRLLKSHVLTIVGITLFIIIMIVGANYLLNSVNKQPYKVSEYTTIAELEVRISELESANDDLEKSKNLKDMEIEFNNRTIRLYKYIIANNIKYDDFINNYTSINSIDNSVGDKLDFNLQSQLLVVISTVIMAIIMCAVIINYDFSNGIWKQIYASNTRRNVILRNKFFALQILVFFVFIFLLIVTLIISSVYRINFKILVFDDIEKIFVMQTIHYLIFIWLCAFMVVVFLTILIFSISTFIKNMYIAILANSIIIITYILLGTSTRGVVNAFFAEPSLFYSSGIPIWLNSVLYIVRWGLIIGILFLARTRFIKREFC